jgi:hypothetical protein
VFCFCTVFVFSLRLSARFITAFVVLSLRVYKYPLNWIEYYCGFTITINFYGLEQTIKIYQQIRTFVSVRYIYASEIFLVNFRALTVH